MEMKSVIFLLLVFILVSLNVNSISVVSDYLVNDTLELMSGESKIYSIRLQNPANYEAGIKLEYDTTFMKVIDYEDVYILPPKTTGYKILFNITAPTKPGLYRVSYTVSEVEPSSGGGLPIRLKINRIFNLKVIKNPKKFYIGYNYAAYAVVILALLLYFFRRRIFKKPIKTKYHKSRKS